MPDDSKVRLADEWCVSLLVPSSLSVADVGRLSLLVQDQLRACAAAVARTPACSLTLNQPAAPAP